MTDTPQLCDCPTCNNCEAIANKLMSDNKKLRRTLRKVKKAMRVISSAGPGAGTYNRHLAPLYKDIVKTLVDTKEDQ